MFLLCSDSSPVGSFTSLYGFLELLQILFTNFKFFTILMLILVSMREVVDCKYNGEVRINELKS